MNKSREVKIEFFTYYNWFQRNIFGYGNKVKIETKINQVELDYRIAKAIDEVLENVK